MPIPPLMPPLPNEAEGAMPPSFSGFELAECTKLCMQDCFCACSILFLHAYHPGGLLSPKSYVDVPARP